MTTAKVLNGRVALCVPTVTGAGQAAEAHHLMDSDEASALAMALGRCVEQLRCGEAGHPGFLDSCKVCGGKRSLLIVLHDGRTWRSFCPACANPARPGGDERAGMFSPHPGRGR